jgi:DNA polymerase I-like protein with 3'-5' exonuclease and polymerase domains
MLMQADAAALELRVAAFLSQDPVMIQELVDEVDLHTNNKDRFGLPDRLTAKKFGFRLLYGGSAYSYANDPDFTFVSTSEKFWQKVIDAYYEKYDGIKRWHVRLLREAVETGKVISPTGREYVFQEYNGSYKDTQIKNYVVQGTGADLMALARVSFHNRLKKLNYKDCLLVNTVHDSIVLDYNEKVCDTNTLAQLFHDVFRDLPKNFEKLFLTPFNVPMTCEVLVGTNWENMEEIKCS